MIVLDTNVISELMRLAPDPLVLTWLAAQPRSALLHGEHQPRRASLRCRPSAADHYARIVALRREAGRPIAGFDALIAAVTAAAGFRIATRDAGGFTGCRISVVDPWQRA